MKRDKYFIDEYRIIDGQNVEIKAHVHANFDGISRGVDFTGRVPLERLIELALKQTKLNLANKIRLQAGVKGPNRTWRHDAREEYERLWVLATEHGVDFLNPEPSDPAKELRSELDRLHEVQRKYPDANLKSAIEDLKRRINRLEG